jgi:hypothetical protein
MDCVRYKGMEFNIGSSANQETPHPMSIHYLVIPDLLLVPEFVLLEDISPSSVEKLLDNLSIYFILPILALILTIAN